MITVRATWEEWDSKHKEESCHVVVTSTTGLKSEGWYYIPDDDEITPYWSWVGTKAPCPPEMLPYVAEIERYIRDHGVDSPGNVLEWNLD